MQLNRDGVVRWQRDARRPGGPEVANKVFNVLIFERHFPFWFKCGLGLVAIAWVMVENIPERSR